MGRKQIEPKASPERKGKHFSKSEDSYIKKHFLKEDYRTIARHLGRSKYGIQNRCTKLGLKLPAEVKQARNMCFPKGHIPANKGKKQTEYMSKEAIEKTIPTRFKKGQINHNSLYDGAITTRHHYKRLLTHKYIRLSKGVWQELQIYYWEKKNGPVPKGFVLACKDGNTLNCRPGNWKLLSMRDNMLRNSAVTNLPDRYVVHLLAGKKNKDIKEELLKYPELIEVKRRTIILKRRLKRE